MIHQASMLSGFASKLPSLKNKEFKFTPGLNILYGPNGCGKSSLLLMLASHSGIPHKYHGWSRLPVISQFPTIKDEDDNKIKFPHAFRFLSPDNCRAIVDWDGTPTFLNTSETDNVAKHSSFFFDENTSPDGIVTDNIDHLHILFDKESQGEKRVGRLCKIIELLKNPPNITKATITHQVTKNFINYISSLPRKGPVTLLLDEPDKSLSIDIAYHLMFFVIPKHAENVQIIMSTHNPLACFIPNANIIDMEPGYERTTRLVLSSSINFKTNPRQQHTLSQVIITSFQARNKTKKDSLSEADVTETIPEKEEEKPVEVEVIEEPIVKKPVDHKSELEKRKKSKRLVKSLKMESL